MYFRIFYRLFEPLQQQIHHTIINNYNLKFQPKDFCIAETILSNINKKQYGTSDNVETISRVLEQYNKVRTHSDKLTWLRVYSTMGRTSKGVWWHQQTGTQARRIQWNIQIVADRNERIEMSVQHFVFISCNVAPTWTEPCSCQSNSNYSDFWS
jgi:hypothetical protein